MISTLSAIFYIFAKIYVIAAGAGTLSTQPAPTDPAEFRKHIVYEFYKTDGWGLLSLFMSLKTSSLKLLQILQIKFITQ